MNNIARFALALTALTLTALPARAQFMRSGPPSMHGVWRPAVGTGAAYDMTSAKTGKPSSIEFTVVGKATIDGKDGYWLEMTMPSDRGGEMIIKTFVVTDGSNTRTIRMIMQMPGQQPMEMTQMANMHGGSSTQSADVRNQGEDLGSESVTTPAGTFVCEHYRAKDGSGDVWISDKVSPWGMVKFQGKDSSMLLARVITGAKDKITGTPVPFNPMAFGQQGQQPPQ